MLDKPRLTFLINALMFLVLMAMAGIGFLMKYVLLPGKERWVKYGRKVDLTLLGLDRHQWGGIHLYLGFLFLGLLTVHIILHWKQLVGLCRRFVGATEGGRTLAILVFVLLAVLLIYFPFLVTPEVLELGRGGGRLRP